MSYKFNPFIGNFDYYEPTHFSYKSVKSGQTVTIKDSIVGAQQMLVKDGITIIGTLQVDGDSELVIIT